MIGPEGAATLLAACLADALTAKTTELRARLAIADAFDLPDVRQVWYGQTDTTAIEAWPLIEVVTARTLPAVDEGDGVLRIGYAEQLWMWSRGTTHEQTARVRDRLMLAVTEILAAQPGLASGVQILPGWAWSLSNLVQDKESRTLGGARLDLIVEVEESLDPGDDVPVPRITSWTLDTSAVPPRTGP